MACNCSKNNSNCGCNDVALTNPCSYTDCSVGSERCEDIQCASCVSYCGTSFQIGDAGSKIVITSGERLDSIIQKFSMILANGLGSCTSDDVQHDPYNVYAGIVTKNSAEVLWNGVWSNSTGIDIYIDKQINPQGWTLVNTTPIVPTTNNFKITNLVPNTLYKIKVVDAGLVSGCIPIEILISTGA